MKRFQEKILEPIVAITIILVMTLVDFLLVGMQIASYAIEDVSTNNKNVEFSAYFKDSEGNEIDCVEKGKSDLKANLYLKIAVKQQGYLNANVVLSDSNFEFKETENELINSIDNSNINLNQINAGKEVELEIPIEAKTAEVFDLDLLNAESLIKLEGIYRDSSKKDKQIKVERKVNFKIVPENTDSDNIEKIVKLYTNKTLQVGEENKRVVQIGLNTGLKDSSYPIKEIEIRTDIPQIDGKDPETYAVFSLNTMSKSEYNIEDGQMIAKLENDTMDEKYVLWKNEGTENVVYTYLYDADVIEDITINGTIKVTLYDDTQIETEIGEIVVNKDDEKEEIITASSINSDEEIYKGKLNENIDRKYQTKNTINVNANEIVDYIELREDNVFVQGESENIANVIYDSTTINKTQMLDLLGEEGYITIIDEQGEVIEKLDKETEADDDNITIEYDESEIKQLTIKTTKPVKAGELSMVNEKTIVENNLEVINNSDKLKTKLSMKTNLNGEQEYIKAIGESDLKNTTTSASIEINKDKLSTAVDNNVEIKAILHSKNEANDLYKNPILNIELPEQVEKAEIDGVSIVYDNELKVKDYSINERTLTIVMEGEQTQYIENVVDGANVVINAKLQLNRKTATTDSKITMKYSNEKARAYENDAETSVDVKITAPTDVTTITTIPELGIEEFEQEESKEVLLQKGVEQKEITPQIEIINNKDTSLKDVKVLGVFPTRADENSIGINIESGINVENAEVYYSENEDATNDLENEENEWNTSIENASSVRKYLIVVNEIGAKESIFADYKAIIPENLGSNENAEQSYEVTFTDSNTNYIDNVKATQVKLSTGGSADLEVKLSGKVGTTNLDNRSEVKAGEVIKYNIEISNNGSDIARNVELSSLVPEGTTLVEPKEMYDVEEGYFKEVGKDDLKEEIEKINPGEKIEREYTVRVDTNITDGIETTNKATAKVDDLTVESNELKTILKSGDFRVTIKRLTTSNEFITNDYALEYHVIVENISSQNKDNVTLKTNFSKEVEVVDAEVLEGDLNDDEQNRVIVDDVDDITDEDFENDDIDGFEEDDEYSEEVMKIDSVDMGNFEAGESKVLYFAITLKEVGTCDVFAIVEQGGNQYRSNLWQDTTVERKAEISITSDAQKYIDCGSNVEFTIKVKNTGTATLKGLRVVDEISSYLDIESIEKNGKEIEIPDDNDVGVVFDLKPEEEGILKIETYVDYIEDIEEKEIEFTNKAIAELGGDTIAETEEATYIIKVSAYQDEDETEADGISGIAWCDENADGKRDSNEKTLQGINIRLLNIDTNELVSDDDGDLIEETTSSNGRYNLSDIEPGRYIVIFNYDTSRYSLTKYKVAGASEAVNSNAMNSQLTIGNETREVACTDIIQVEDGNVSNINIGLVEVQGFDLKLDKYVSRIILQNGEETAVREYDNSQMAKIEVGSKYVEGTVAIVEYRIVVTNIGEIDGYAKKIADYMPNDFKFNSELNTDWYIDGSNLYSTSLTNEKIRPGESKELKLTLTKTLSENNLGLSNNTAEIAESYNNLGIADKNSTAGNKTKGENDMSSADIIISISTGRIIAYTSLIIIFIAAIAGGITIPIIRKSKKENNGYEFTKI